MLCDEQLIERHQASLPRRIQSKDWEFLVWLRSRVSVDTTFFWNVTPSRTVAGGYETFDRINWKHIPFSLVDLCQCESEIRSGRNQERFEVKECSV